MKCITIICLAIASGLVGCWAAVLWLRASQVPTAPDYANDPNAIAPVDPILDQMSWTVAILKSSQESAKLNASAARWTAAAVLLGVVTTIVGALPCR